MLSNIFDMTGRVALVTGSTKGIGRSIAEQFVAFGARVTISSRSLPDCEAFARQLNAKAGAEVASPCAFDFANASSVEALVDAAVGKWGRLDTLVGNAYSTFVGYAEQTPPEQFTRLFNTNVLNNIVLAQRALPTLIRSGDGNVIFIGSVAGIQPTPFAAAYGISKRALLQVVENYALEWARHNIRVNAVVPGNTRTQTTESVWSDEEALRLCVAQFPLKKFAEPAEIAAACVLLSSRAGCSITGQALVIDNGRTLRSIGSYGMPVRSEITR